MEIQNIYNSGMDSHYKIKYKQQFLFLTVRKWSAYKRLEYHCRFKTQLIEIGFEVREKVYPIEDGKFREDIIPLVTQIFDDLIQRKEDREISTHYHRKCKMMFEKLFLESIEEQLMFKNE